MEKSILSLLVLLLAAGCAVDMEKPEKVEDLRNDQVTELFPTISLAAQSRLYIDEWGEPVDGEYSSEDSENGMQAHLFFENGRISEGEIREKKGNVVFEYSRESGNWVQTVYTNGGVKTLVNMTDKDFKLVRSEFFYGDGSRWTYMDSDSTMSWYRSGQLETKVVNLTGKAEGEAKRWHENGELASISHFKDDEWHGTFKKWDENGSLIEEKTYDMGMPEGVHKFWDTEGNLIEETAYEDGKPVSLHPAN